MSVLVCLLFDISGSCGSLLLLCVVRCYILLFGVVVACGCLLLFGVVCVLCVAVCCCWLCDVAIELSLFADVDVCVVVGVCWLSVAAAVVVLCWLLLFVVCRSLLCDDRC